MGRQAAHHGTIIGHPIPRRYRKNQGKLVTEVDKSVVIFPNDFAINGDVETSVKRSIYQSYCTIQVCAWREIFLFPKVPCQQIVRSLSPKKAYVVIGISALKGIDNKIKTPNGMSKICLSCRAKDISFQGKANSIIPTRYCLNPQYLISVQDSCSVEFINKSDYAFHLI